MRRSISTRMCLGSATPTTACALESNPRCSARPGPQCPPDRPLAHVRVRPLEQLSVDGDLPWFAPAVERVRSLSDASDPSVASFLVADRPVAIGRAPGRLDVMGGIADYSGS